MTGGYVSFGYLDDEPAAFARPALTPKAGRVPAYDGGFDAGGVARAERLLAQNIVVSLHDHPVRFPADMADHAGLQPHRPSAHRVRGPGGVRPDRRVRQHDGRHRVRHREHPVAVGRRDHGPGHAAGRHRPSGPQFMVVRTLRDIAFAQRRGRVGIVFGLEAATPIGNDLDKLDILFGLGVRQIGIAYSDSNGLGAG